MKDTRDPDHEHEVKREQQAEERHHDLEQRFPRRTPNGGSKTKEQDTSPERWEHDGKEDCPF